MWRRNNVKYSYGLLNGAWVLSVMPASSSPSRVPLTAPVSHDSLLALQCSVSSPNHCSSGRPSNAVIVIFRRDFSPLHYEYSQVNVNQVPEWFCKALIKAWAGYLLRSWNTINEFRAINTAAAVLVDMKLWRACCENQASTSIRTPAYSYYKY